MNRRMRPALLISALALLATVSAAPRIASADEPKTFRMIVGEPRSMDPNLATDYSIYVNAQLFEPLARMDNNGKLTLLAGQEHRGRAGRPDLDHHAQPRLQMVERAADHRRRLGIFLEAHPRPEAGSEVASFFYDIENAEDYNKGKITDVSRSASRRPATIRSRS